MPTVSWKPDADGNWNVAGDWSTGALPGAGDQVVIATADPHTITFNSGTASIGGLTVGDDPALVGGPLGRGRALARGQEGGRHEGEGREEKAQHQEHHDGQVLVHGRVRFYHGTLRTSTLRTAPGIGASAAPGPRRREGAATPGAPLRSTG